MLQCGVCALDHTALQARPGNITAITADCRPMDAHGLLTILEFPDPRLRTRAAPVARFRRRAGAADRRHARDHVRRAGHRAGGHPGRTCISAVIVIDVSEHKNEPQVFINPRDPRARRRGADRGRLPVGAAGLRARWSARRACACAPRIATARCFERDLDGLLAVCVQHEMDHLDGKLFVDYLSSLKRERIRRKLEKEQARARRPRRRRRSARDSRGAMLSRSPRLIRCSLAHRLCRHAGLRAAGAATRWRRPRHRWSAC